MSRAERAAFSDGRTTIYLPVKEVLGQQHAFVHGGVLAYLADMVISLDAGAAQGKDVTNEFKINDLRPVLGDLLIAKGKVLHQSRRQCVCREDVSLVAHGIEKICATAQDRMPKVRARDRWSVPGIPWHSGNLLKRLYLLGFMCHLGRHRHS